MKILFYILLACASCSCNQSPKRQSEVKTKMDSDTINTEVLLSIDNVEKQKSDIRLMISIVNNTDCELLYDPVFVLQYQDSNQWVNLKTDSIIQLIEYVLPSHEKKTFYEVIPSLPNGQYRIIKCFETSENKYKIEAPFEISF